jgi:cleavage stimulation factor subunit 3
MKNGIKANKLSFLLHYQFVENEEANHRITEVRETLESLLNNITIEYDKFNKMAEFMRLQLDQEDEADNNQLIVAQEAEKVIILERQRGRKAQREIIDRDHEGRMEKIGEDATNAWIALMQAIRRAEGIKAARQIFARARKVKPISHHIFAASGIPFHFMALLISALMEYHCNDDKGIATKVFELGLKSYQDKPDYVLLYLNFLIQINDVASISQNIFLT